MLKKAPMVSGYANVASRCLLQQSVEYRERSLKKPRYGVGIPATTGSLCPVPPVPRSWGPGRLRTSTSKKKPTV